MPDRRLVCRDCALLEQEIAALVRAALRETNRRPTRTHIVESLRLTEPELRAVLNLAGVSTFRHFISSLCARIAADHLRDGHKVVAAMYLSGYRHKTSFNTQFRKQFGCLPREYRRTDYIY